MAQFLPVVIGGHMTSLRPFLSVACLLLPAVFPAPCAAYLYDCGPAQYAGAIVKLGSTTEWVSEPFSVQRNAYATQFGAALGFNPFGFGQRGSRGCALFLPFVDIRLL